MAQPPDVLLNVRQSLAQGRIDQARAALQRALQRAPGDPDLNGAMAVVQARSGQAEQAAYFAERAARAGPEAPASLVEVGAALAALDRAEQAVRTVIDTFERSIAKSPAIAGLRTGLAAVLRGAGRFADAARQMEAALELKTDSPALALAALNDLIEAGLGPEAAGLAARMSRRFPADLELAGLTAYYANYLPDAAPATVAGLHRSFGELLHGTVAPRTAAYTNPRDPGRRLRVGLLSPDFRFSAVGFFIEPFFAHRDRGAFEIFAYSVALKEDAVGARLRALADGWLHEPRWTDEKIAAAIERDGVDILIDLAGLTAHSRLGVMAMRPAPVSATYLGYPNTTGLAAIDWRVVDGVTDPPVSEADSVERLLRMDGCFVCYRPPEDLPAVAERTDRPITFGSFNNLLKFNGAVAALWARVLAAVPGSRLVMKAPQLSDPGSRADVTRAFEQAGADASRIELLRPVEGTRGHLAAYSAVDIALDTFPYCGTTTTCEALLMGVPVVTLRGASHRARVGASLLAAAGRDEWAAGTPDEYIAVASSLASDRARLASQRSGLRARLLGSPLCDGPSWCRRLEAVLRKAWVLYCGSGSPEV